MSRLLFCFAAGMLYCIWLHCTGLGIPCLFYLWTGFKCPGCGITRMCLALLSGYPEKARQDEVNELSVDMKKTAPKKI